LIGCQAPRIANHPSWHWSAGDDCAFLAHSYGLTLDEWQQDVVTSWLGEDAKGRLVAGTCGLAVPRQNGKNGTVEAVQLYKMVVQGRKILHTAHEVKTARKHFLRMKSFFEDERRYPELFELARGGIRQTNGQEAITLSNGGSIEFVARSRGSGRGYTVDDLFFDEAQDLTDEQQDALLPTISASPTGDPQQVYMGTPPGERSPGGVFARLRTRGVSGKAKRFIWHEWSIPDETLPADAVKKWRENAYSTNPALGIRLNIQTVQDELAAMSPEGFARERCGWWEPASSSAAGIDFGQWDVLRIPEVEVPTVGRKVFAVVFAWDGSGVGLAAALRPEGGGPVHVDPIRQAPMGEGTHWVAEWLLERHREAAQIVIYGKGQTEGLINALRDGGARSKKLILTPAFGQMLEAHGMLEQAIKNGSLTHLGLKALDAQVKDTVKVPLGGKRSPGFGWASRSDQSIVMLEAVTFAHWGARITKRRPVSSSGSGVSVL